MNKDAFVWRPDLPPPQLESHSAAKLRLIETYLARYFDVVAADPRMDRLQISLVDGFCGGGVFDSDGQTVHGTPLIMLQAVKDAETRLNLNRHKKLTIDARFYFVDKDKRTLSYLERELKNTEFGNRIGESVHLFPNPFEDCYSTIIEDILSKSRVGRSIFLLDQCGYSQVSLLACRRILWQLPSSEIIWTIATDWLINFMSSDPSFVRSVTPLELDEVAVRELIETKGKSFHRYIIQRSFAEHLRSRTDAPYFTPFFLHSADAHRDLWLVHLSKHPTARNVMVSSHWEIQNRSIHQGRGGFDLLGYDPNWENTSQLDFGFDADAETKTLAALREDIPRHMAGLDSHGPINVAAFLHETVNRTPASLDHLQQTTMELYRAGDLEIWTRTGRKKQPYARLKSDDLMQLARQPIFSGFKIPKK